MLTEIISNCPCCSLPCCTAIYNPMFPSQYTLLWAGFKRCYNENTIINYTLRELGFPYKNPAPNNIVTLESLYATGNVLIGRVSCFKEEGFKYKWTLTVSDNGASSYAFGDINEEGVLVGLPTEVPLFCRYGSSIQLGCSREAKTTTTTTTPCLDSWWSYQGVFSDGIFTGPDCVRCVCQPDAPNPGQTNSSGPYSDLASCEAFAKPINDLLTYPNGTPRCR